MSAKYRYRPQERREPSSGGRIWIIVGILGIALAGLVVRLFQLQILEYSAYKLLASDQHEVQAQLVPKRGTIFLRDRFDGSLHPVAKDRETWQVYSVRREITDATSTAVALAPLLELPAEQILFQMLYATSSYQVLSKDVPMDTAEEIRITRYPGIGISKGPTRFYPEQGLGGQVFGFVSTDDKNRRVGKYGLEGSFDEELAGTYGSLLIEKDAAGRRMSISTTDLQSARDGSDLVLTLDRAMQYEACRKAAAAVAEFQAESASILVMDPETGAIWAMCAAPDFDPANYGKIESISVLNNSATFDELEPGSIFKPFTMAAGIEEGKISPNTTYTDPAEEKIDDFTVRNSDKLAHGVQTMTEVLTKSLNLGTIFVQRLLGKETFRKYVHDFGFGTKTGVGIGPEADGDIRPLDKKGAIFAATASYGQGISVTQIQMLAAYGALANGGRLMKPFLVKEIIHPDGQRAVTEPRVVHEVISKRTSRLVSGMMVTVVEAGHGKRAGVPGYYVAGKTGTAQVPNPNGPGYLKDATIGSFAGYAPSDHPRFVMLVTVVKPKTVSFAESSAAPVFGDMAKFILSTLQVPPERPIKPTAPIALPPLSATGTTATTTGR
ncbi:penicillin-binding protein 2 [Candidatus Uhrbacteria bacterium]|nr:penicillin-binding protein 2 [Candidatus Uhrbacteria bacterium]